MRTINIVNEVFEEMEVDDIIEEMDGESDKDQQLSNDSDCINDCSENLTEISERIVDNLQISALTLSGAACLYTAHIVLCGFCSFFANKVTGVALLHF